MPDNEIEIRFKPADCTPENIAKILRSVADKFEDGRTRFVINENGNLIGGAVLDTAEGIKTARLYSRVLGQG